MRVRLIESVDHFLGVVEVKPRPNLDHVCAISFVRAVHLHDEYVAQRSPEHAETRMLEEHITAGQMKRRRNEPPRVVVQPVRPEITLDGYGVDNDSEFGRDLMNAVHILRCVP